MDKVVITLPPSVCVSPNKILGRHFSVYMKHKQHCGEMLHEWELTTDEDIKGWKYEISTRKPLVKMKIEAYGCRPKDVDNCVAGMKAAIDQLRYFGYLNDDNPSELEITARSLKASKRKDERVVLTLEYDSE